MNLVVEIQINRRDSISSTSSGDSGTPIDGPDDHLAPSSDNQVCLQTSKLYYSLFGINSPDPSSYNIATMRFEFNRSRSILENLELEK